jgi:hypothetical protein
MIACSRLMSGEGLKEPGWVLCRSDYRQGRGRVAWKCSMAALEESMGHDLRSPYCEGPEGVLTGNRRGSHSSLQRC